MKDSPQFPAGKNGNKVSNLCKENEMYAAIYIFINQNSMKTVGDSHLYEDIQEGRRACLFCRSIPEDEIE